MIVNDYIHVIAGIIILTSLALGHWLSPYWFLLTAFSGANLLQYGVSKFCPMGALLKKLGVAENRAGN